MLEIHTSFLGQRFFLGWDARFGNKLGSISAAGDAGSPTNGCKGPSYGKL